MAEYNNTRRWQILFTALGLIVTVILYGAFTVLDNKPVEQKKVVKATEAFCEHHYNVMKMDTFVALLDHAYGDLINHKIDEGLLQVEMKHASELTKDFFNGNDALLKLELGDHGFKIEYNKEEQSLKALFRIDRQNGVNVPNDVLIKLIDKVTSANHVNN